MTQELAGTQTSRIRSIIRLTATAMVLSALAVHFAVVLAFSMPPNPIAVQHRSKILAYMHPYFEQQWNFFGPDPIDEDLTAVVRFRDAGGRATAWLDISNPLVDDMRRNRLAPSDLLKLDVMTMLVGLVNEPEFRRYPFPARESAKLSRYELQPLLLRAYERFAVAMAAHSGIDVAQYPRVQVAYTVHQFPRFAERDTPDDPGKDTRFIVFPDVLTPEVPTW